MKKTDIHNHWEMMEQLLDQRDALRRRRKRILIFSLSFSLIVIIVLAILNTPFSLFNLAEENKTINPEKLHIISNSKKLHENTQNNSPNSENNSTQTIERSNPIQQKTKISSSTESENFIDKSIPLLASGNTSFVGERSVRNSSNQNIINQKRPEFVSGQENESAPSLNMMLMERLTPLINSEFTQSESPSEFIPTENEIFEFPNPIELIFSIGPSFNSIIYPKNSWMKDSLKSIQSHPPTINYGFEVYYNLGPFVSLSTGVEYYQIKESYSDPDITLYEDSIIDNSYWEFDTTTFKIYTDSMQTALGWIYTDSIISSSYDSTLFPIYDSISKTNTVKGIKGTNVISRVSIPLVINFRKEFGKFRVGLSSGLLINHTLKADGEFYSTENGRINFIENELYSTTNFSALTRLSFDYLLPNVGIGIQSSIRYPIGKSNTIRFQSIPIKARLIYKF